MPIYTSAKMHKNERSCGEIQISPHDRYCFRSYLCNFFYCAAITFTLSNRPPSAVRLNCHRNRTAKLAWLLAAAGTLMVRVDQTFCVTLNAFTASSNVQGPAVPAVL